jgi:hypothetical protein
MLFFNNYPEEVSVAIDFDFITESLNSGSLKTRLRGTCLDQILDRPCKNSLQLHARQFAWFVLNLHGPRALYSSKASLAHTKSAVAFAWGMEDDVLSVGVDIERRERHIPPQAAKFFATPKDFATGLDLLSLWCVKEAAFKCLDQFQQRLNLRQIIIEKIDNDIYRATAEDISCICRLVEISDIYCLSLAWKLRTSSP